MTAYQTLVNEYAAALQEYAELDVHSLTCPHKEDRNAKREAYNRMLDLQNALWDAAFAQAQAKAS